MKQFYSFFLDNQAKLKIFFKSYSGSYRKNNIELKKTIYNESFFEK